MKSWPVVLSCLFLCAALAAQSPDEKPPALCTVQGQFVQAVGGVPLRKVEVRLNRISEEQDDQITYVALTDAEGRFKIGNIRPGVYRVEFDRAGFVDAEKRHYGMGMRLSLSPGDELKDLLFHLAPAAVITGKVVDNDGDPINGAIVAAFPYGKSGRPPSIRALGRSTDLGEYRIAGLRPGRYLVVAEAIVQKYEAAELAKESRQDVPTYVTTYYPGTTEREEAVPVELHFGDETPVNFTMTPVRTFRVQGQISGLIKPGEPVTVSLRPRDGATEIAEQSLPLSKDGKFDIHAVTPGLYGIALEKGEGENWEVVRTDKVIRVTDADVEGLQITSLASGEVRGRLRMESGEPFDWSQASVQLDTEKTFDPAFRSMWGEVLWDQLPSRATAHKDGSFEMKNVPADDYRLGMSVAGLPDYFLKRVELGGKDVGDSGFGVAGGKYFLDVVISARGATLEGVVTDEKDHAAKGVFVVCLPDSGRRGRHDLYHMAETDSQGHFSMRGVGPGEYRVFALDTDIGEVTENSIRDPEFVKAHESLGQTVKVSEGERKTLSLKAIEEGP